MVKINGEFETLSIGWVGFGGLGFEGADSGAGAALPESSGSPRSAAHGRARDEGRTARSLEQAMEMEVRERSSVR